MSSSSQVGYPSDFINLDHFKTAWVQVTEPGYGKGIVTATISDTLDIKNKTGVKTIFMKMPPNSKITSISKHDSWEQLIVIKGHLKTTFDGTIILPAGYVNRKPYVPHGPFEAHPTQGCLMLINYHFNALPKNDSKL